MTTITVRYLKFAFTKWVKQVAGILLILVGGYFGALGLANDTSKYRWEDDRLFADMPGEEEIITSFRRLVRDYPDLSETFKTKKHGALLAFGGFGGIFGGIGFILFMVGSSRARRLVYKENEDDAKYLGPVGEEFEEVGTLVDAGILHEEASNERLSEINEPEGLIVKYRAINYLVTLAQGDMGEEHARRMVKIYRPDMVKYLKHFSDHSVSALGLQIARAVILRHRRSEVGTSDQQFRAQDDRIRQCEHEVFIRRYMPPSDHRIKDGMKKNLGKVFALYEQDRLQHEFGGELDEWSDISLRNASEVLAAPVEQPAA